MLKLLYITHPAVKIDKNVFPHQWILSEEGRKSIQNIFKIKNINTAKYIYTSEEPKAIEVASSLSGKFSVPYETMKDLGEADRTKTPFLPQDVYMKNIKKAYESPDKSICYWETHNSVIKRNIQCLKVIKKKWKEGLVIIVGHGGAGTLMKCYIRSKEPDFAEDPKQTGCYFVADLDKMEVIQDWKKY